MNEIYLYDVEKLSDLLLQAHNSMPEDYQEIMKPYLNSFVDGVYYGESDKRLNQIFYNYWIGYFIYHYQQKNIEFNLTSLKDKKMKNMIETAKNIIKNG